MHSPARRVHKYMRLMRLNKNKINVLSVEDYILKISLCAEYCQISKKMYIKPP